MAKVLSPMRVLRARRDSNQDTAETMEIDFNLGIEQGVELFSATFSVAQAIAVPGAAPLHLQEYMSLHVETGALEGGIQTFPADELILNSEIIAEAVLQIITGDTAQVEGVHTMEWLSPNHWNFLAMLGKPLLLAQNLTFRSDTSASTLTVNGPQLTLWYRYVKLTQAELVDLFTLRR